MRSLKYSHIYFSEEKRLSSRVPTCTYLSKYTANTVYNATQEKKENYLKSFGIRKGGENFGSFFFRVHIGEQKHLTN